MNIVLLFVGSLFVIVGCALLWQQLEALLYFKKSKGKVIALEKRSTPATGSKKKGGPMYYPVIEYIALGNKKTFTGSIGSSWPSHQIGESVSVLYSVKKDTARLKSMLPIFIGTLFAGMGIVVCVMFFNTFSFSFFSIGFSALMGIFIISSIWKALKKRDISSLDELKESFRNTNMKTREGTKPEQTVLIQSPEDLELDKAKQTKALKYVGPIFTVVGLATIGLAVYLGIQRAQFLELALQADGEVIELNRKRSDDSYVYYPVVEFKLPGSYDVLSFEHESGSNPPSYAIGDQVVVLYDPSNPYVAIIDGGIMNWFGTGIAALLGIVFTSVGIGSVRKWLKYKKYSGTDALSPA